MKKRQHSGADRIATERVRQTTEEGWTFAHDDQHVDGEMVAAACCYAALARRQTDGTVRSPADSIGAPRGWPWDQGWWKPSDDPSRNLIKAGALLAAELDRLQRLALLPALEPSP